jgi:hypothetical protein
MVAKEFGFRRFWGGDRLQEIGEAARVRSGKVGIVEIQCGVAFRVEGLRKKCVTLSLASDARNHFFAFVSI